MNKPFTVPMHSVGVFEAHARDGRIIFGGYAVVGLGLDVLPVGETREEAEAWARSLVAGEPRDLTGSGFSTPPPQAASPRR